MITTICRRECWFRGRLHKPSQRYDFPDGTKIPHHFEVREKKSLKPIEEMTKAELVTEGAKFGLEWSSKATKDDMVLDISEKLEAPGADQEE